MIHRSVAVFVTVLSFIVGCAGAPERPRNLGVGDYSYLRTYGEWLLPERMNDAGLAGLSVAVVDDQDVVWMRGFGFADRNTQRPVTEDTVFRVASVSKVFTGAAVLHAVDQGKLNLDQPYREFVPEFQIKRRFTGARPITLRDLLTHHAGLPGDRLHRFVLGYGDVAHDPTEYVRLPVELRDEYAVNPPGVLFSYSNLSYSLAGAALARATGLELEAYSRQHIFGPLQMERSSFRYDARRVQPHLAVGYTGDQAEPIRHIRDVPAGSLFTTARDLAQFARMLFHDGRAGDGTVILSQSMLAEMFEAQNEDVFLDGDFKIALPWWLNKSVLPGTNVVVANHGGDLPPFHAFFAVVPESKLAVILMTNSRSGSGYLSRIAGDLLRIAYETKTGRRLPEHSAEPPSRAVHRPGSAGYTAAVADIRERGLARKYATGFGIFEVRLDDGELEIDLQGQTMEMLPLQNGDGFALRFHLFGLIPLDLAAVSALTVNFPAKKANETGRPPLALYALGMPLALADPFEAEPVPDAWRRRIGEYERTNAGPSPVLRDFRIAADGDIMRMHAVITLLGEVEAGVLIHPVSDNEAVIYGAGRNLGETIAAMEEDGEELLMFSGMKFRKK